MPGIFGIINKTKSNRDNNEALIRGMLQRLSHNPDYRGQIYADDWFALGHIEIPFADEKRLHVDNKYQMAASFSGFIYGWKDLESELSSATPDKAKRLIDIYIKHGIKLPEKIDGSFNAVIINSAKREALICNDRFGHRQLYYFEDETVFLFSTEMKAFLAYDKFPKKIDFDAVADYFNFTYPLGNKTFFKAVKILEGGHNIIYKNGKIEFSKYWDYNFGDETKQSTGELIEEIDVIYQDIIKKRIAGAKQVVIPLSGGLDSRFILAHTIRAGVQPYVFTHGKKNCLDYRIARQVAETLGAKNYGFVEINPLWFIEYCEKFVYMTEGMINTLLTMLIGISSQYRLPADSTAFLNGIFGGPTNFGSSYFKLADITDKINHEEKLKRLRYSLAGGEINERRYNVFQSDIKKQIRERFIPSMDIEFSRHLHVSPLYCNQKDVFFIKNRIGRHMNQIDCHRYIWHDHFALADDKLVDFFIKLPAQIKPGRVFLKDYFMARLPELAGIPYQATGVNLYNKPSSFKIKLQAYSARAKYFAERLSGGRLILYDMTRYQHFNQWYRSDKKIPKFYEDILLDSKTINRGYYNKKNLQQMLKKQRQGSWLIFELSELLAFEMFNRLFVD
jgi:asparagine synthase (glutamine-hydrolysing)